MAISLYQPPPGTYDLPFTWIYDASGLVDGNNYPNQFIYLLGGYGEFILRRIVGLSRILDPVTGQYQIREGTGRNYIQSDKVFGVSADDIAVLPEMHYPELGAIRLDLFGILLP